MHINLYEIFKLINLISFVNFILAIHTILSCVNVLFGHNPTKLSAINTNTIIMIKFI